MWRRRRWGGRRIRAPRFHIRRPNGWPFLLLVLLAALVLTVWSVEQNLHPILMAIAKNEVKRIAQEAMLEGVREVEETLQDDLNRVMAVEKDGQGKISQVRFQPRIQAQIYETLTEQVAKKLKNLKNHQVGITIGQIFESKVFSEWGPDLPIEMWPKGASKVSLAPRMEAQGINMVMVTLVVRVHTEMGMVVPFTEETFPVDFEYPIAQTLVVGEVPQYYFYNDQGQIKKGQVQVPVTPVPEPPQK